MKKLHIHMFTEDLNQSREFYNKLFDQEPSVVKEDYMKWELAEPALNFAISARGNKPGIDHLGIQVQDDASLNEIAGDLNDYHSKSQKETTCCYAKSNKEWLADPQGVNWEIFRSIEAADQFSASSNCGGPKESACC